METKIFTPGLAEATLADHQTIPVSVATNLAIVSVNDPKDWIDETLHVFAPTIEGTYIVLANVYCSVSTLGKSWSLTVKKNGVPVAYASRSLSAVEQTINLNTFQYMDGLSDILTFEVFHDSNVVPLSILSNNTMISIFLKDSEYYLDPLSNKLNVGGLTRLSLPSNQAHTIGSDDVTLFIAVDDPKAWFDDTTHRFQPQIAGYYMIALTATWDLCAVPTSGYSNDIYKNGLAYERVVQPAFNVSVTNNLMTVVYLNGTSDYLYFRSSQGAQASLNLLSVGTFVDIMFYTVDSSIQNSTTLFANQFSGGATNPTVVGAGTTLLPLTALTNDNGWFNNGTKEFKPNIEGLYLITYTTRHEGTNYGHSAIRINKGTGVLAETSSANFTSYNWTHNLSVITHLDGVDDSLIATITNDTSGALSSWFSATLLSANYYSVYPEVTVLPDGGIIVTGNPGGLTYYLDGKILAGSDLNYVTSQGIERVDGVWMVKSLGSNLSVGTKYDNPSSYRATVIGGDALSKNVGVNESVVIGDQAAYNVDGMFTSVVVGTNALYGGGAGIGLRTGSGNVVMGWKPMYNAVTVVDNIVIGKDAYSNLVTGSNNINLGSSATGVVSESGVTRIGEAGIQEKVFMAGIRDIVPDVVDGKMVVVSSEGQLTSIAIPANPVNPGIIGRLAYYGGTNEIDDTDINYTANRGLTRADGLKYVIQEGVNTYIGTNYERASNSRAIVIGENALATYGAVCDESIAIGPQAGTLLNTLYHSVILGTNAGLGLGAVTTRAINDSVAIGWRTLVSAQSIINSITIGQNAYESLSSGANNINLGNPGVGITSENNTTRIGSGQSRCFIAGIRGVSPDLVDGLPVVISSTGQLSSASSAPVNTGTVNRLAFYDSVNSVDDTDIAYTASRGLVRSSDNLAYIYNNVANTSLQIGNILNPATHTSSTIIGRNPFSLATNPSSIESIVIGNNACRGATSVTTSVIIGASAGSSTTASSFTNCVLLGATMAPLATSLSRVTAIGGNVLYSNLLTGSNNINIGDLSTEAQSVTSESNTIRIGGSALLHTRCFIGGIYGVTPALTDGQVVEITSGRQLTSSSAYVKGPASSTDNAIARFDLATGKLLQNSSVTIDDNGVVNGPAQLIIQSAGSRFLHNSNTGINNNVFLGNLSGNLTNSGSNNIGLGNTSLTGLTGGSGNLVLGTNTGTGLTTQTNNIIIGNDVTGLVGSNNIVIGNIIGVAENNTLRIGGTQTTCYIPAINTASAPTVNKVVMVDASGLLTTSVRATPVAELYSGFDNTLSSSLAITVQNQFFVITPVNFPGTSFTLQSNNSDFTSAKFSQTNNRLNYLGETSYFTVNFSISARTDSAINTYQYALFKNSLMVANTMYDMDFAADNIKSTSSLNKLVSLTTNDYLEVGVQCTSSTATTFTLTGYNLMITAATPTY